MADVNTTSQTRPGRASYKVMRAVPGCPFAPFLFLLGKTNTTVLGPQNATDSYAGLRKALVFGKNMRP